MPNLKEFRKKKKKKKKKKKRFPGLLGKRISKVSGHGISKTQVISSLALAVSKRLEQTNLFLTD